jgi:hypothetical protein
MSLKAFHIFFIALATLTLFLFGTWWLVNVEVGDVLIRTVFGVISYAAGLVLIIYGRYFLRKFRHFSLI